MGPRHGDELNLIVKGDNYGWPVVSQGDNYSGRTDSRIINTRHGIQSAPEVCVGTVHRTVESHDLFGRCLPRHGKATHLIGGLASRAH